MAEKRNKFTVVDLFSGAGGMSFGFAKHPAFKMLAAADAELGKPSSGPGKLQCNTTYQSNIGVVPTRIDLGKVAPSVLRSTLNLKEGVKINVLSACPPCTGFSRANPQNHLRDDRRNSLVRRSGEFAVALDADILVMENARELIRGNFSDHYEYLCSYMEDHGYRISGRSYMLSQFGLPQIRERAIVIAAKKALPLQTLDDLWDGWAVAEQALTVRRAFSRISKTATARDLYPRFASPAVLKRISVIPRDGGSWMDLRSRSDADELLTGAMKRIMDKDKIGSYPDVYGRMSWDRPAPTIKRECSHIGNGRYAHPEENRLCTLREMAILQGFPNDFVFDGTSLSNAYRHIGDAVPPLISHQMAQLCHWVLTGRKPTIHDLVLPGTSLSFNDMVEVRQEELFYA